MTEAATRFHEPHAHLQAPFGADAFGRKAESFARFFGTPRFLDSRELLELNTRLTEQVEQLTREIHQQVC